MAGGIFRKKKEGNYVVLDKHCLQNPSLSWAAKGLHSYLMGLPDDWKINITDLKNRSKDGRDGTTSAMNALIASGYVIRQSEHDEKGKFAGYNYFVFEAPEQAETFKCFTSISGISVNGKTVNGKSETTKYYNNQLTNKLKEEEESAQGGNQDLQPSEQKEKINPPVAPPPPDKKESEFTIFDIDRAAAEMTTDFRCVERFAREFKCSIETATDKHPKAVLEFVEDQKTVGTIYHADRQFRSHYFSWLPKRAAAKLAEKRKQQEQNTNTTATTNQYKRLTTDETFIPRNIPIYR